MATLQEVLAMWNERIKAQPELNVMDMICPRCHERIGNLKPSGGCIVAEIEGEAWHPQCADEYEREMIGPSDHPTQ